MNILGFVFIILISLTLIFRSFESQELLIQKQHQSYAHYFKASRKTHDRYEKLQYKLAKGKSSSSNQSKKIPVCIPHCSKINLWPLVHQHSPELYTLLINLLDSLYQNNLYLQYPHQQHLSQKLLDTLLVTLQQEELSTTSYLATIPLQNPDLQPLYYALLKGCPSSTTNQGVASLLQYISLEKSSKKDKICIACADFWLLSALFTPRVAALLWKTKQKPHHQLQITQQELEEMLYRENPSFDPLLWNYIQCKHPSKKNAHTLLKEESGNVVVERSVFLSSS